MRIKSIPEGARFVKLTNNGNKNADVKTNGRYFLSVPAHSFSILESDTFLVGFPMECFPKTILYSNAYVDVEVFHGMQFKN